MTATHQLLTPTRPRRRFGSQAEAAAQSRPPLRTAAIAGLGHTLPEHVVTNETIAERIGVDDEWIVRRTGMRTRRYAAAGERVSTLAARAGHLALQDAGIPAEAIDLVVVATMTQDEITPNTAPLVAHALGAERAGAFDVGAACTGFLSALSLAAGQVETGRADAVLVIGAEVLSRFTDPDDKRTAALFGDGAGAAVVTPATRASDGAIDSITLRCDGGLAPAIVAAREDPYIRMDGHSTFKAAVQVLTESTLETCELAGIALEDIDLFVYHQANGRIISAVAERLGVPAERVADYVADTGNTSAASIPLTLSLARADGRLHDGDRVLLGAVGAGFTWGAGLLTWPHRNGGAA